MVLSTSTITWHLWYAYAYGFLMWYRIKATHHYIFITFIRTVFILNRFTKHYSTRLKSGTQRWCHHSNCVSAIRANLYLYHVDIFGARRRPCSQLVQCRSVSPVILDSIEIPSSIALVRFLYMSRSWTISANLLIFFTRIIPKIPDLS